MTKISIVKKAIITIALLLCGAVNCAAQQQITVSPQSVNVYSQGATTVFLTFGGLQDYRPADSQWCGEVMPATVGSGQQCVPGTIYGMLPRRYDISRRSGINGYTDIVSVPASVARKAYQAAAAGQPSEFYYVRRFVSASGGSDQYVTVLMRLSGNGAGVPFSLTSVQLAYGKEAGATTGSAEPQVLFVEPDGKMPPVRAEIRYTGTGRLRGRWEVVQPGDPLPEPRDLLTEASLPQEERGTQQRYRQLARFNVFLPPGGRFTLPGPEPNRVPSKVPGQYLILLRIEASDDSDNDSDLTAVGAGAGIVNGAAAAGFALPVIRYVIGGGDNSAVTPGAGADQFGLILPHNGAAHQARLPLDFVWSAMPQAVFHRLEIEDESGQLIHAAVLKATVLTYRAPSWLKNKLKSGRLQWRVVALDQSGTSIGVTERRGLRLE